MLQDIQHALRGFLKTPVFTAVALVTLTLAIGANTAMFSLLNALVLRDLPVRDPHTLVQVSAVAPDATFEAGLTFPMYREFLRRQPVFSAVIGWLGNSVFNIETDREQTSGAVWVVSGNFFSDLGVRAFAGRALAPQDVNETTLEPARVAVLGYGFWQRHFGGDASVIGRRVRVEGQPFEIVGIAPQGFAALGLTIEPDLTIPLTAFPLIANTPAASLTTGTSFWVRVTGRLKPAVTIDQARAALDTLWPQLKADTVPPGYTGAQRDRFLATRLSVASAAKGIEQRLRDRYTQPLVIVFGIAALVLLIACVNLASLMLSRTASRAHEIGVRLALGAGRWRVARQLLIEGVLLSVAGALLGIGFAWWSSQALVALLFRDYLVPASLRVGPDARILAFTTALAVGVGVFFTVVPAWRASRLTFPELLRQSTRTVSGSGRAGRFMVAAQVGLSLVLLTNAGLLVRTLLQIRAMDSGMRSQHVLVAYPSAPPGGYVGVDNDTYYPALVERLKAVPGVQQAAVSLFKPAGGGVVGEGESVARIDVPSSALAARSLFMAISPAVFDTLGIGVRAGRDFSWSDNSRGRRVAIVSDSLARRLFGSGAPMGRHISIGVLPRRQDLEIVGVVADARIYNLKDPNTSAVYVPALQDGDNANWKCFVIRGGGVSLVDLNRAVEPFGHEHIRSTETMPYITDRVLLQERIVAMLAAFFGALALLLAAVGLYGLMSYAVAQRRRDIGIRIALGADRGRIIRAVVGDGLAVTMAGVTCGFAAAFGTVRLVKSLLFGVTTSDPVTLAGAPATLVAVALIACLLPAVRASHVDPITTLRD
ncbi:MAG: ABC transporter permease [Acidobacteriia bacterium]|nr:ABC transporter permease [Terriglobia bacterium]